MLDNRIKMCPIKAEGVREIFRAAGNAVAPKAQAYAVNLNDLDCKLNGSVPDDIASGIMTQQIRNIPQEYQNDL